jgi:DUF1707 SHOCT-like domain
MAAPPDRPGGGPPDRPDAARLRISDADRHRVADVLRQAAGEGRLEIEELDERLEATYAAKTYADLVPITADLPSHPGTAAPAPAPRPGNLPSTVMHDSSLAILGETKRVGQWLVPPEHRAVSFLGSVKLDLREATFSAPETVILAHAVMAGVDIVVDPYTHVIVEGVGVMGDFSQGRDKVPAQITPDSPVVRVKGLALMGGVSVVRKGAPGSGPRRLLRGG